MTLIAAFKKQKYIINCSLTLGYMTLCSPSWTHPPQSGPLMKMSTDSFHNAQLLKIKLTCIWDVIKFIYVFVINPCCTNMSCYCLFSTNNKISVANGPNTSESKNQFNPVLFFPCASAAFINANVPQPTKYWLSILCPPFTFNYTTMLDEKSTQRIV